MPNANEIGKGQAIRFNGDIMMVLETQHRTPGNLRAFVQMTLRGIRSGKSLVQRFGSNDALEVVPVNRTKYEYSYKDNNGYNFIEPNTFETITVNEELVADIKDYLIENLPVQIVTADEKIASIEPPSSVVLKVTEAAEGVKGDSANNVYKACTVETGLQVQVPLFIKEGELIKIGTADGKYLSRA
ncbi:MAG: elongation factor P [Verrucomicrobiota bacterium]